MAQKKHPVRKKPDETTVRRLSLVRQLYRQGLEQSYQSEPTAFFSILSFQDAVELFLATTAEFVDAKVGKNTAFTSYWDLINARLKEEKISNKVAMNRLNKARVDLKHYGILPNVSEIETSRVATSLFLADSTQIVYGLEFEKLSLVDLISSEKTKNRLKKAEGEIKEGNVQRAIAEVAIGFHELVYEYESHYKDSFGRTKFLPNHSFTFDSSFHQQMSELAVGKNFKRSWDKVVESVEATQQAVRIMAMGLDYRKYVVFDRLTPHVAFSLNRTPQATFGPRSPDVNDEEFRFCLDFVVDSAFSLQKPYVAREKTE